MKSKILSTILILSTIFMTSISTFAAESENESETLKQLILKVNQVIEIPKEYNDFSYSLNNSDIRGKNIDIWSLNWANDTYSNISVSIDSEGNFYSYYKNLYNNTETGTGNFSRNDSKQVAQQFLEKVIPTYVNQLREDDNAINTIRGNNHTFRYKLYVNDIPVEFSLVTVNVNKYTNEVIGFSADGLEDINYPSSNNIITKQDAKKLYLDRVGVNLKYYSYFDYKTKKLKVFPAYSLNDDNIAIDSNTGKLMLLHSYGFNPLTKEAAADEMSVSAGGLTPEEEAEVKNTSNLISKEKAESIVRENVPIISSDMKVSSVSLSKSNIDSKYIYSIYFEEAFAQVNAVTGELISFFSYKPTETGSLDLSQTKSKEIAQQFLEKVASDKLTQTRYDEPYIVENPQEIGSNYQFKFIRQINGIDFIDNYLNVEIDKTTGDIVRYSNTWYDNVAINDIGYVMTDEIAFDKFDEVGKFGLSYSMVDEDKVGLVYKFTNLDNGYLLDPIKSVRLDYKGEEYSDESLPEYSDIKGHWCEEYVTKLLENGYYIKGDKFNPNNQITQIRFLKYLYSPRQNSFNTDDEFYQGLIEKELIDKEDVTPNSYITLQDAAKFITKYMGYEKLAVHPEIFANLFENKVSDEYKGYITICYSLGIIEANADNTIRNSDSITNAQTAKMIYKLINLN